ERRYIINENDVHIVGEGIDFSVSREDFSFAAEIMENALKENHGDDLELPDAIENFMNAIQITEFEAVTDDRTDFYIIPYSEACKPVGIRVYSRIGGMTPLLDGGRAANFKFEQQGVRFPSPTVNKINSLEESDNPVCRRMLYIESLGGTLKYSDVADKIFRSNLAMIDLHLGRVLAEMVRVMHLDGITKISDLVERINEINPVKVKDELITRHRYYEYKVKQLLLAVAFGMRPAKLYNGIDGAIAGFVFVDKDGKMLLYSKLDQQTFADFLFANTRLERGSTEKDKYGYLERENGKYYLKLNLKIGIQKR
ncbi:MAG: HpaII family restriction endonuclease, partial [Bacteroidaceae bacterium]|nr:HpaII family restriction endonuclease [Bacteroidaceae bacterium]